MSETDRRNRTDDDIKSEEVTSNREQTKAPPTPTQPQDDEKSAARAEAPQKPSSASADSSTASAPAPTSDASNNLAVKLIPASTGLSARRIRLQPNWASVSSAAHKLAGSADCVIFTVDDDTVLEIADDLALQEAIQCAEARKPCLYSADNAVEVSPLELHVVVPDRALRGDCNPAVAREIGERVNQLQPYPEATPSSSSSSSSSSSTSTSAAAPPTSSSTSASTWKQPQLPSKPAQGDISHREAEEARQAQTAAYLKEFHEATRTANPQYDYSKARNVECETALENKGGVLQGAHRVVSAADTVTGLVHRCIKDPAVVSQLMHVLRTGLSSGEGGQSLIARGLALCLAQDDSPSHDLVNSADTFSAAAGPRLDALLQRKARDATAAPAQGEAAPDLSASERRAVAALSAFEKLYDDPSLASKTHGLVLRLAKTVLPALGAAASSVAHRDASGGVEAVKTALQACVGEVIREPQVLATVLELAPMLSQGQPGGEADVGNWVSSALETAGLSLGNKVEGGLNAVRGVVQMGMRSLGSQGSGLNQALGAAGNILSFIAANSRGFNPEIAGGSSTGATNAANTAASSNAAAPAQAQAQANTTDASAGAGAAGFGASLVQSFLQAMKPQQGQTQGQGQAQSQPQGQAQNQGSSITEMLTRAGLGALQSAWAGSGDNTAATQRGQDEDAKNDTEPAAGERVEKRRLDELD